MRYIRRILLPILAAALPALYTGCGKDSKDDTELDGGGSITIYPEARQHRLFNDDWRFIKDDPPETVGLSYEEVKQWVLPTGNAFISNPENRYARPEGNPGDDVAYIDPDFDDSEWRTLTLPHDYAVEGPYTQDVPANMGHLPAIGTAWYRKAFELPKADAGKSFFIDFDGAMSYSMVWVNGRFVGGWPYGYTSFRLDVTPYVKTGEKNVVAVRLDNPVPADKSWDSGSSRWYPGAGIYRDVWLVTTDPVHVAQWGTYIRTPEITQKAATVELDVTIDNDGDQEAAAVIETDLYEVDGAGNRGANPIATISPVKVTIEPGESLTTETIGTLPNPRLWGPLPSQTPNLYEATTVVTVDDTVVDVYETRFGVRTFDYDPDRGLVVNGEPIKINGVCNHHDLGALGAVANVRGKERQLEILTEMGANGIRTAHNPETPALYELTDRMGFLVMDEAFDVWFEEKTALDHHLFFEEWHEQDLRAMIRRDRNHPSIFMWSLGNEVLEQYDSSIGATVEAIRAIVDEEDATRQTVTGMNAANPGSVFADAMEAIGLNYQGSGVRDADPEYPDFHEKYPDRFIVGTETTNAYSSRGIYTFPIAGLDGQPIDEVGGKTWDQVSSYDLYHADWTYIPDLEFESQDRWAYAAGEFVWTGFDYLGEPDPHSGKGARSSYSGIVDLAGFPKDRFYLYQANWRPDLPMVHMVPHWTWPDREGEVTPIHVYTSGDEAEVFINGKSQGRKKKGKYEYRLRWDDVTYASGEVKVVAYKNGKEWATKTVQTSGKAVAVTLTPDREAISADGRDLSFITAEIVDAEGRRVPNADNPISFTVSGPGEIVATDNGDPTDQNVFSATERNAFNGLALAIVRRAPGQTGKITVTAASKGLTQSKTGITAR